MKNDFTVARFRLVLLYLIIMASVIILFSVLIVYQANDSFSDPAVKTDTEINTTAGEATQIARTIYPDKKIEEVEYEIENGGLYFTTSFEDEQEVKVDLFTGAVLPPDEDEDIITTLTDDFDKMVIWIGLFVFLVASLMSAYIANTTLSPMAKNIAKQKQFVSDAAHELRNPLAAMHARIESVVRKGDAYFTSDVLQDLLVETKRLITTGENLLSLEQAENTKMTSVPISLERSVLVVVERLEHMAHEKHITVQHEIDSMSVTITQSDAEHILYNLLHNAIKFTGSGGEIKITFKKKVLTITDSGMGINAQDLPHIFDRFYKADTARSEAGSGLGLALVSEILKRYHAHTAVASAPGKGTTFTITFA